MIGNEVSISGRVGKSPERHGNGPWRFSIARGGGKKKDSDERWPTEWFPIVAWPNQCDASQVGKGDKVEIEGYLKAEKWTDKQSGQERERVVVVATSIHADGEQVERQARESEPQYSRASEITDEDIPF